MKTYIVFQASKGATSTQECRVRASSRADAIKMALDWARFHALGAIWVTHLGWSMRVTP